MSLVIGDTISVKVGGSNEVDAIIIAIVEDILPDGMNSYIIEHQLGWLPNNIRQKKYSLDAEKKYLFVNENELTAV